MAIGPPPGGHGCILNATDLVDCAIAITANERVRVLYADGPDLKWDDIS